MGTCQHEKCGALLPLCGGDGEGVVTTVSPPCCSGRRARGCRNELLSNKRGSAENWRASLSPADERVQLELERSPQRGGTN